MAALHCMVDIESLGKNPGCVILSIGACLFDPINGTVLSGDDNTFYTTISIMSCVKLGLVIDPDTLLWWLRQSQEARDAAFKGEEEILGVLHRFANFCRRASYIWCHGATFDVPILSWAYRRAAIKEPWEFWDVRDTRTIFHLSGVTIPRTQGTHHHALNDAQNQAVAVCEAYRKLSLAKRTETQVNQEPTTVQEGCYDTKVYGIVGSVASTFVPAASGLPPTTEDGF